MGIRGACRGSSISSQYQIRRVTRAGARPTNVISIEFEIRSKFGVLWFKIYLTDNNAISHTSRQCNSGLSCVKAVRSNFTQPTNIE